MKPVQSLLLMATLLGLTTPVSGQGLANRSPDLLSSGPLLFLDAQPTRLSQTPGRMGNSVGLSSLPLVTRLSSSGSAEFGVQTQLHWVRRAPELTVLAPTAGLTPQLEPQAYLGYQLIPQRLGLQSAVRLGSGRDARGVAVDLKLSSQFALTDASHLGLVASTSWLNGRASQQLVGQMTGSDAVYAMDPPYYGLRDVRAGISLTGPLIDRWSYAAGANLGRFFGDPRATGLLPNGGNGRTGLVFFNANYTF